LGGGLVGVRCGQKIARARTLGRRSRPAAGVLCWPFDFRSTFPSVLAGVQQLPAETGRQMSEPGRASFCRARLAVAERRGPASAGETAGCVFLPTLLAYSKRVGRRRGARPPGFGTGLQEPSATLHEPQDQKQLRRSRPAADRLCLLVQTKSAKKGRAAARGMAFAVGGAADGAGMKTSGGASSWASLATGAECSTVGNWVNETGLRDENQEH